MRSPFRRRPQEQPPVTEQTLPAPADLDEQPEPAETFTAPAAVKALTDLDRIDPDLLDDDARADVLEQARNAQADHELRAEVQALAGSLPAALAAGEPLDVLHATALDTAAGHAILGALPPVPTIDLDEAAQGRAWERIKATRAEVPRHVPVLVAVRETQAWLSISPDARAFRTSPAMTAAERALVDEAEALDQALQAHRDLDRQWADPARYTTALEALAALTSLLAGRDQLLARVAAYTAAATEADRIRVDLGLTWDPAATPRLTTA